MQVDNRKFSNEKATQKNVCAQIKKNEGNCLVIVCDSFRNKMCKIYAIPV